MATESIVRITPEAFPNANEYFVNTHAGKFAATYDGALVGICETESEAQAAIEAHRPVKRLYGVSYGNGDGVSRLFPRFAVLTDDPYELARLCMLGEFGKGEREWAEDTVEVDGEADYTVSATIYDPPAEREARIVALDEDENEFDPTDDKEADSWRVEFENGEVAHFPSEDDAQAALDDYEPWSSVNGAWMIVEVFPLEGYERADEGDVAYVSNGDRHVLYYEGLDAFQP